MIFAMKFDKYSVRNHYYRIIVTIRNHVVILDYNNIFIRTTSEFVYDKI